MRFSGGAHPLQANCSSSMGAAIPCYWHQDIDFLAQQTRWIGSNLVGSCCYWASLPTWLWDHWQSLELATSTVLVLSIACFLHARIRSQPPCLREYALLQPQALLASIGLEDTHVGRARVLKDAAFMAIDFFLDLWTGLTYCYHGFWVFGPVTVAIPPVSGLVCFLCKRWSWQLAPHDHELSNGEPSQYYNNAMNRHGRTKPGLRNEILQVLQLEAFATASAAYTDPMQGREWMVERAFMMPRAVMRPQVLTWT